MGVKDCKYSTVNKFKWRISKLDSEVGYTQYWTVEEDAAW